MRSPRFFTIGIVFLILITVFGFLNFQKSFATTFTNTSTHISDSRKSISNVEYTLSWTGSTDSLKCIKILFCTTGTGSCTVPTGLDTTSAAEGNFTGITASNWTLNNSVNGTLKLTNAAGEAPTSNVSLQFSGIQNPSGAGAYYSRINSYSDDTCSSQVDSKDTVGFIIMTSGIGVTMTVSGGCTPTTACSILGCGHTDSCGTFCGACGGGGGGGGAIIDLNPATVILEGKAYPGALITILKNNAIAGNVTANSVGEFSKTLTGVPAGTWTFGIYAEDTDGRRSVILSFTVGIIGNTTNKISGIFISPTISLSGGVIRRGATLEISGQAYPKSEVDVFIASSNPIMKQTTSSDKGKWKYPLDTKTLALGDHTTKAKAITSTGEQSPFSDELIFKISELCQGPDLNGDGKVNITDFSILLYFWGQANPSNICVDINSDGKVNIVDFSIMMYGWTK